MVMTLPAVLLNLKVLFVSLPVPVSVSEAPELAAPSIINEPAPAALLEPDAPIEVTLSVPTPTLIEPLNELESLFKSQVAPPDLETDRVPAPLEIKPLTVLSLVFDPPRVKALLAPDAVKLTLPPTNIVAFALPALFEIVSGTLPLPTN